MAIKIQLNTIDKVKSFVDIISKQSDDFDIVSDNKYVINAKSIMGIFSLDLSKELELRSATANEEKMKKIVDNLWVLSEEFVDNLIIY